MYKDTVAKRGARKLGIECSKRVLSNVGASKILNVLGPDMFAEVTARQITGKVVWCNFELARQLGLDAPRSNHMLPAFHQQLIDALSYHSIDAGQDTAGQRMITLYADKYGGDGVAPALGSARAGFLPYGNIFIKGVGFTPLFRHNDLDDFLHSHGGFDMHEGLAEAVFGEVNANLFSQDSTRILAIIDQEDYTRYPDGSTAVRAVVARVGNQLRPGHVLAKRVRGDRSRFEVFISLTRATGHLVSLRDAFTGNEIPDIKSTMLRIIDDHARVTAEQARWRITHGALSTSNMQMNGGMLDVTTERAHPRSFPIRPPVLTLNLDKAYSRDYVDRVRQMKRVYRAVVRSAEGEPRQLLNFTRMNIKKEMDKAYLKHLEENLLCAAGLKRKLAQRVRAEHADLAHRFAEVIMKMTDVVNPTVVKASRLLIRDAAVLNVFELLRNFAERYFEAPDANHTKYIRALLKPIYKGNRFHVASKRAMVNLLINEFADVYKRLMDMCRNYAEEFYCDVASMQDSIKSRAAFENRPMSLLYRADFYKACYEAVRSYKPTGNADLIRTFIDKSVSASLRNIDRLLSRGASRLMPDGGLDLQMLTTEGIQFSVRAWNDEKQTRQVHICIPVELRGNKYVTAVPDYPSLTARQIRSLRYRFTTDEWASWREVAAHLERDNRYCLSISFKDIEGLPMAALLEGMLYDKTCGALKFKKNQKLTRYVFAIPDRQELRELIAARAVEDSIAKWNPSRRISNIRIEG